MVQYLAIIYTDYANASMWVVVHGDERKNSQQIEARDKTEKKSESCARKTKEIDPGEEQLSLENAPIMASWKS
jgi:hypothetical protein